ncbi:MAG: glutaredoxin family protein [Betaproteobacteria bacterium]|nr:glutaredoxin family protein [Betaproteobacteria bacterium]
MSGKSALTVYVREHCHLCHEMVAAIEALQPVYAFDLEVIDVDEDMALEQRYGNLVPVLTANGEEICHYHLDLAALDAYFGKIR